MRFLPFGFVALASVACSAAPTVTDEPKEGTGGWDGTGGSTASGTDGSTSSPSSSGSSGSSGSSSSGPGGGTPGAWCEPIPACDAPLPDFGEKVEWKDSGSPFIVQSGPANHRGRDLLLNPGAPQWVLGKFAYGYSDKDLTEEDVDIWLLRDCGEAWEFLGTATTTEDGQHASVEGVEDDGGQIYFQIPESARLGPGRHRVVMVVKGDHSYADQFIEVIPKGTPIVVSDVDGTLTGKETEEYGALLQSQISSVREGAPEALQILAKKGYHPVFLTARPTWLVGRTREFLNYYNFPPGVVHTTLSKVGATGDKASSFKTFELLEFSERAATPTFAFGNTETDAQAYDNVGIDPVNHRVFIQFDDQAHGGRRIESYTELHDEFEALPSLCD